MSSKSPLARFAPLALLVLTVTTVSGCIDKAVGDLLSEEEGGGDGGGGGGGGGGADFEGEMSDDVNLVGGDTSEGLCAWVWDVEGSYSEACPDCDFSLDLRYVYNESKSDLNDGACSPSEDFEQTLAYVAEYPYNDTTYEVMMYEYNDQWYPVYLADKSGDELSWTSYTYEASAYGYGYYYTYSVTTTGTLN